MKIKASEPIIEYHAIRGSYGKVSYFMTKTNLRDVAENLMLAPQGSLSFGERIQRIVNRKRVEEEILPYLERNELRFFNSLVCILLPETDDCPPFWSFDEYKGVNDEPLGGLGKLKIAKRVDRVVLDGQHRFEALKDYWQKYNNDLFSDGIKLEVSIIFVCIDDIGILGGTEENLRTKTITAVRNLFAVLNKTARSVDKTTLLLIDDTDIKNVFTRKLVEDELLGEDVIKWTAGQNLTPEDPYFTSLHVVKDAISFLLRDFDDAYKDYGVKDERDVAISRYYDSSPNSEIPLKDLIPKLIEQSLPFEEWTEMLESNSIKIKLQPERTKLTAQQSKLVKEARRSQLYFTVAGQKVFYRALLEVFLSLPRKDNDGLAQVISNASTLLRNGLLSRAEGDDNPFLGLLFDPKLRMSHAESLVDCGRQIFSIALGSPAAKSSIISKYVSLTDRSESVLNTYWDKAKALLSEK